MLEVLRSCAMAAVFSEFTPEALASMGARHTIPEILGQPGLWEDVYHLLEAQKEPLNRFLDDSFSRGDRSIVLTGAGSSAFIGELLQGFLARRTGLRVRAVPTTDIVTHSEECLSPDAPTLLVSFARSGNSPESVAALNCADDTLKDVRHLIITCNPQGMLADHPTRNPTAVFTLPSQADDKGLAMTGSFTGMALAGLLMADINNLHAVRSRIQALVEAGRRILAQGVAFQKMTALDFHRAIFLGSGPMKSAARECHLKLQELTNGKVICSYDSFLGFRHGPKAAIDSSTLLVFLCSGSPAIKPYEEDLLAEIQNGERGIHRLAVGGSLGPPIVEDVIPLDDIPALEDEERAICSVLAAQVLGVYRSLALGLHPDDPSPSGTISRVVKGVTIYPRS